MSLGPHLEPLTKLYEIDLPSYREKDKVNMIRGSAHWWFHPLPGTFPFSFIIPHHLDPWNLYQHDLPAISTPYHWWRSWAMALAYMSTYKGEWDII